MDGLSLQVNAPSAAALVWAMCGGSPGAVTSGSTTALSQGGAVVAQGDVPAARALAERALPALAGATAEEALVVNDFLAGWTGDAAALERRLTLRTFVCGHTLTVADVVVLAWLRGLHAAPHGAHVARWLAHVEAAHAALAPVKAEEPSAKKSKEVDTGSQGSWEKLELTDAVEGQVVVRFPPEPSGWLHLGHAKAVLLNDYYRSRYKGKLIVRFDDTNPAKEKEEYCKTILEDLAALGIQPDRITYTSDNFDHILTQARQLIVQGDAYVDDDDQEAIKKQRFAREESRSRSNTLEENLRRWDEMLAGTEFGQRCVLRARIDMKSDNGALRDPALARCVTEPHARTGTRFKCYPTYDLAIGSCDALEGVTHAMRDSQYQERLPLYAWVLEKLHLRPITIRQFSRINFKYTVLSKRKMDFFVSEGFVDGWDDPALPTIRGILRRGLSVEALRTFILSQGASVSKTNMSMSKLWNINKQLMDDVVPRFTVVSDDHWTATVDCPPGEHDVAVHPKNASMGTKKLAHGPRIIVESVDASKLKVGEELTLLDWGNAIVESKDEAARTLALRLHLAGNPKKTSVKATWLCPTPGPAPRVTLLLLDHLITTETLPQKKEGGPKVDWTTVINPNLKTRILCVGEGAMTALKPRERLQIKRRGFFSVDSVAADGSIVLVDIPDGKEGPPSALMGEKK